VNTKGIILWLMAGAGVFLIYCAVKNVSPTSLVASYLGSGSVTPLTTKTDPQYPAGTKYDVNGDPLIPTNPNDPNGSKDKGLYDPKTGQTSHLSNYPDGSYTQRDQQGVAQYYNAAGYQIGTVPAAYQGNPNLWLPAKGQLA